MPFPRDSGACIRLPSDLDHGMYPEKITRTTNTVHPCICKKVLKSLGKEVRIHNKKMMPMIFLETSEVFNKYSDKCSD